MQKEPIAARRVPRDLRRDSVQVYSVGGKKRTSLGDANFPADITAEVDGLTTARYTPVKGVIIAGVLGARRAGASSLHVPRLLHHSRDHACCRGGQVATPTMAAAVFAVGAAQLAKSSNRCFSALHAGPRPS